MIAKFHRLLRVMLLVACAVSVPATAQDLNSTESAGNTILNKHNKLSVKEKQQGWQLLFDGKSLNGWHVFQFPEATPAWHVQAGMLTINLGASGVQHGDLATNAVYENFELSFEWQTPDNGNSGLFINVQEVPEYPASWQTGPEYQLLGPAHADNADPIKRSGEIFGFASAQEEPEVLASPHWNHSVIRQVDGKVEFYLNNKLTTQVDFNSQPWLHRVSKSRFKDQPHFATSTKGHIVLQEWTSLIFFRNMKIKQL
ncbi:hypothetical protein BFC17_03615 [Alteromonas lipolytica]|uniref:3-keto-alpha-glucoside-1,2-lyase/3-keto-2-hydroxy-glucal hydratase domain-containing protein n=2 Tax=Alteromonas lipolytica TaxID=1856405 RepID=A0A1E8FBR6_9ALTE|nr:hypothetical protein BFC17_03615 [Alteromonas lipolytica]